MTKEFKLEGEPDPRPSSDSFMEPRTIPKKWDVSAFESTDTSSRDGSTKPPSEPTTSDDTRTYDGEGSEATFEPFPKPRTVPGQWDVSDLI
jgi:hypothetical protein